VAPLSRAMRRLLADSPASRPRAGPNLFLGRSAPFERPDTLLAFGADPARKPNPARDLDDVLRLEDPSMRRFDNHRCSRHR